MLTPHFGQRNSLSHTKLSKIDNLETIDGYTLLSYRVDFHRRGVLNHIVFHILFKEKDSNLTRQPSITSHLKNATVMNLVRQKFFQIRGDGTGF